MHTYFAAISVVYFRSVRALRLREMKAFSRALFYLSARRNFHTHLNAFSPERRRGRDGVWEAKCFILIIARWSIRGEQLHLSLMIATLATRKVVCCTKIAWPKKMCALFFTILYTRWWISHSQFEFQKWPLVSIHNTITYLIFVLVDFKNQSTYWIDYWLINYGVSRPLSTKKWHLCALFSDTQLVICATKTEIKLPRL